jgi:hypothetical protein
MPHTHPARKQEIEGRETGRLGKPGAPAASSFRLPAWRQPGGVAPVMAGISTTILLGNAALREPSCQIPFASGSPHVPGPGLAILEPAAADFSAAPVPTGDPGAAMGQDRFPPYFTLRTSLTHSLYARSRASSLQFTGE